MSKRKKRHSSSSGSGSDSSLSPEFERKAPRKKQKSYASLLRSDYRPVTRTLLKQLESSGSDVPQTAASPHRKVASESVAALSPSLVTPSELCTSTPILAQTSVASKPAKRKKKSATRTEEGRRLLEYNHIDDQMKDYHAEIPPLSSNTSNLESAHVMCKKRLSPSSRNGSVSSFSRVSERSNAKKKQKLNTTSNANYPITMKDVSSNHPSGGTFEVETDSVAAPSSTRLRRKPVKQKNQNAESAASVNLTISQLYAHAHLLICDLLRHGKPVLADELATNIAEKVYIFDESIEDDELKQTLLSENRDCVGAEEYNGNGQTSAVQVKAILSMPQIIKETTKMVEQFRLHHMVKVAADIDRALDEARMVMSTTVEPEATALKGTSFSNFSASNEHNITLKDLENHCRIKKVFVNSNGYPTNVLIFPPQFEFVEIFIQYQPVRYLIIYTDKEKTSFYKYVYDKREKSYYCSACKRKNSIYLFASFHTINGQQLVRMVRTCHICDPFLTSCINDSSKSKLEQLGLASVKQPNKPIHSKDTATYITITEGARREEGHYEYLQTTDGKEYLFAYTKLNVNDADEGYKYFYNSKEGSFRCLGSFANCCALAKRMDTKDGKITFRLSCEHKCKPQKLKETIVYEPNFMKKGKGIFVFHENGSNMGYPYHRSRRHNYYVCSSCRNLGHKVSAKLINVENDSCFKLFNVQHKCHPVLYIPKFNPRNFPLLQCPKDDEGVNEVQLLDKYLKKHADENVQTLATSYAATISGPTAPIEQRYSGVVYLGYSLNKKS